LEWLKDKAGAQHLSQLKVTDYIKHYGSRLLALYGNSPQNVLNSLNGEEGRPTETSTSKTVLRSYTPLNHWVRLFPVSFPGRQTEP
jgi:hypothetical protein